MNFDIVDTKEHVQEAEYTVRVVILIFIEDLGLNYAAWD